MHCGRDRLLDRAGACASPLCRREIAVRVDKYMLNFCYQKKSEVLEKNVILDGVAIINFG